VKEAVIFYHFNVSPTQALAMQRFNQKKSATPNISPKPIKVLIR
jgi:hypothetical protein